MKQRTRLSNSGGDLMSTMNGIKDDKELHSEIQLYRIKPQDHFIEAQVQEGDTLQAIALRFHCSISELKRINQIHKDNEIFAKRTIKVPVTPYSVLTEMIPAPQPPEPVPSTSSLASTSLSMQHASYNPVNNKVTRLQNNNQNPVELKDFAIDCNTVVMNSSLAPSVVPYTDTEQNEAISEDTSLLPGTAKLPVEAVVVKELTSHGADFGLKWYHLVGFLLILCVLTPIWYVLFKLDKHEHSDVPPLHPT